MKNTKSILAAVLALAGITAFAAPQTAAEIEAIHGPSVTVPACADAKKPARQLYFGRLSPGVGDAMRAAVAGGGCFARVAGGYYADGVRLAPASTGPWLTYEVIQGQKPVGTAMRSLSPTEIVAKRALLIASGHSPSAWLPDGTGRVGD